MTTSLKRRLEKLEDLSEEPLFERRFVCTARMWRQDEDVAKAFADAGIEPGCDIINVVICEHAGVPRDPDFRPEVLSIEPVGRRDQAKAPAGAI